MQRRKNLLVRWGLSALATLGAVALTVVGVAVGQVIGGPEAAAAVAVFGVLGTVLAGLVPGVGDAARRRREEMANLEQQAAVAQEKWEAVGEPTLETADRGPAALLLADQRVVEFTGREVELGVLRSW